jgi:hypothetical protein
VLHGGRQVDDHLVLRRGREDVADRITDLLGVVELGAGEALGRVLEDPFGVRVPRRVLLDPLRALHGDLLHPVAIEAEDHAPLRGRGGVVEVHDRTFGARQRFEGALDEFLASLNQHLRRDVVGDQVLVDQATHEVEVGLRGRRKADLDLLVAELDQVLEHRELALAVHRLDQGLVAVAQVDAAPQRRAGDGAVGPGAVGEGDRREGAVLGGGVDHRHGRLPWGIREEDARLGPGHCEAESTTGDGGKSCLRLAAQ